MVEVSIAKASFVRVDFQVLNLFEVATNWRHFLEGNSVELGGNESGVTVLDLVGKHGDDEIP